MISSRAKCIGHADKFRTDLVASNALPGMRDFLGVIAAPPVNARMLVLVHLNDVSASNCDSWRGIEIHGYTCGLLTGETS